MTRLPQVLVNVKGVDRTGLDATEPVWEVVRAEEERLGDGGRGCCCASRRAPSRLVRVMAEAETEEDAQLAVDRIADAVRDHLTVI
jgi:phosphoglucosamine mutase